MHTLHLICNAHLDPCWLWEWEEGAATAVSTFRVAADLCEQFEGFVFNHNEVILYKWVEQYEPELFRRIQRLVREKRWHIMGGWYLQPDCNMPCGESLVRQMLLGRHYFQEKFGVNPTTAINFDPFGHSRGLVQIMRKAGYDSYLIMRPGGRDCPLPDDDFLWVGYDGSELMVHREPGWYGSRLGGARRKVEQSLAQEARKPVGIVLWGVGNHGGGPSFKDCADLADLIAATTDRVIQHSTPEAYFAQLRRSGHELHRVARDLNPWAVGCYTSQIRVKQQHRRLENDIFMLEKMASAAALAGRLPYPAEDLHQALCDLMVSQFHDILPGTSIQPVEQTALRLLDHGLEIVSRQKARAFFALAAGQPRAAESEIPILAYNPHPWPVRGLFECEFVLAGDVNWKDEYTLPTVYRDGQRLPSQPEKELSNMNLDWRKRMVFDAELLPGQMNRFDCRLETRPAKPRPTLAPADGRIVFRTDRLHVVINARTGLMDRYAADNVEFLKPGAFRPLVINDNEDPWGMLVKGYRDLAGAFDLMTPEEGTRFSGVKGVTLDSVRVVEEGDVRVVVEALLKWGDSFVCLTYKLPRDGVEVQVHVRAHWNEKDKMLKLAVPTLLQGARFRGQTAYGVEELPEGREVVAQQWVAVDNGDHTLTLVNDGSYGFDCQDGELRLSLLRSPGYAAHPIGERPVVSPDRYTPRIDQGERIWTFWMRGGTASERGEAIDREALERNQPPFLLSFFPAGTGEPVPPLAVVHDKAVQMTVFKKAEQGDDYIIRLFDPTGQGRTFRLELPIQKVMREVAIAANEIKTLRLNPATGDLREDALMEMAIDMPE